MLLYELDSTIIMKKVRSKPIIPEKNENNKEELNSLSFNFSASNNSIRSLNTLASNVIKAPPKIRSQFAIIFACSSKPFCLSDVTISLVTELSFIKPLTLVKNKEGALLSPEGVRKPLLGRLLTWLHS